MDVALLCCALFSLCSIFAVDSCDFFTYILLCCFAGGGGGGGGGVVVVVVVVVVGGGGGGGVYKVRHTSDIFITNI